MQPEPPTYDDALEQGHGLYPGIRIGRPGRARTYGPTVTALRALRVRYSVEIEGAEHVADGAGILIGNHQSAVDPVMVVMSTWWRVTAFTKVEHFEDRGAIFFRLMGQIPLRRGNQASTTWAMDMASRALADGAKIGLYPEGTRSPDPTQLHKLHQRVLIPFLRGYPDVPAYAVATTYVPRRWRRTRVHVRISPPLSLDPDGMTDDELTAKVRDTLLELGGQTYVDTYATVIKRARIRQKNATPTE